MQKSCPSVVTGEHKTSQLHWTCRPAISFVLLITTSARHFTERYKKFYNSSGISCHEEKGFFYLRKQNSERYKCVITSRMPGLQAFAVRIVNISFIIINNNNKVLQSLVTLTGCLASVILYDKGIPYTG